MFLKVFEADMKTSNVIKAIANRRSKRKYTSDLVSEKNVLAILEAARQAPSGINNSPGFLL
jgi:nitroreductase